MTMTLMWSTGLNIQGGANATTRPATTSQAPNAATRGELQDAQRTLRDAIQKDVQREINAATAAAAGQAAPPVPPTPPDLPQTITIHGRNGEQTIVVPRNFLQNTIPQQAVDISIAFFLVVAFIIVGLPLARAFARRMDRRGGTAQVSGEVSSQLAHLNQAVDAIALEVERISEGQRFTTRLLSEQREASHQTLPSGNR